MKLDCCKKCKRFKALACHGMFTFYDGRTALSLTGWCSTSCLYLLDKASGIQPDGRWFHLEEGKRMEILDSKYIAEVKPDESCPCKEEVLVEAWNG